jgi:SynChlorMet cassette protein ScmD
MDYMEDTTGFCKALDPCFSGNLIDMKTEIHDCLLANPEVVLREEFDNAHILFNAATGAMFGINAIGVLVWNHLDGRHSLDDLVEIVAAHCEAPPPETKSHIEAFIRAVLELGLAGHGES